ncbi:MAG: enoyl-CoA hydratase [Hyphomicrobiales bacterium]|nr:enoyl-CoA hydratase [Hyphomicrobiales bacterium]
MAYDCIIAEKKGSVGLIRLNRPDALNALNSVLIDELAEALDGFEGDHKIGCIVITGSDKAFAAGADIKEMQAKTYVEAYTENFLSPWERVTRCRIPVIAAVSGYALGGGCELALMCDFIVASSTAVFGQPEINLGVMPGAGGTQRLARAIGKAKTMDMCLTGRNMDASEAEQAGIVSRIVADGDFIEEVLKIGDKIASFSRPSAMMTKEAINVAFETTLSEGVRFERRMFQSLFATEDQKEGMAAFVEKRTPGFKGR